MVVLGMALGLLWRKLLSAKIVDVVSLLKIDILNTLFLLSI
jgi:hypothetical protein